MKNKDKIEKIFIKEVLTLLPATFTEIQFVDISSLNSRDFMKFYKSEFHKTSFALNELPSKPISKMLI